MRAIMAVIAIVNVGGFAYVGCCVINSAGTWDVKIILDCARAGQKTYSATSLFSKNLLSGYPPIFINEINPIT
jgi:hypothetical protein